MFKSTSQLKNFRQPSSWTSTRSTSPSAVEEHAGAVSKSALMASGFPQIFSHKILPPPHVFFFFSKNFLSRCIPDVVTENSRASPLNCRMRLIFPDSGPLEESFRTTASTFARFVSAAKLFEASPFSAFSLHLYSSHFVLVRLRRQTAVPSSPTE